MVTFSIVEGDSNYLNTIYNDFKSDFINPEVTVKDLRVKYDLSKLNYRRLRDKVLAETDLKGKPSVTRRKYNVMISDTTYIHKRPNGNFIVCKQFNGVKNNFGTYEDFETAKLVRDKLLKSDWDKSLGDELKKEYALHR